MLDGATTRFDASVLRSLAYTPASTLPSQQSNDETPGADGFGFDSRKLTVDDMTRLSRFYAL